MKDKTHEELIDMLSEVYEKLGAPDIQYEFMQEMLELHDSINDELWQRKKLQDKEFEQARQAEQDDIRCCDSCTAYPYCWDCAAVRGGCPEDA